MSDFMFWAPWIAGGLICSSSIPKFWAQLRLGISSTLFSREELYRNLSLALGNAIWFIWSLNLGKIGMGVTALTGLNVLLLFALVIQNLGSLRK